MYCSDDYTYRETGCFYSGDAMNLDLFLNEMSNLTKLAQDYEEWDDVAEVYQTNAMALRLWIRMYGTAE
jgi:hypothetical protein